MSGRAHRAPRPMAALVRAAAVLTLLAGVLAMHALAPVARPHAEQVMGVTQQPAAADSVPMGAHDPAVAHGAAGAVTADGCSGCGRHPPPAHYGAHLLDMCVAVLLAATLTALLVLWARARRCTRTVPVPLAGSRVVRRLSGALRPPSLATLCVLRT